MKQSTVCPSGLWALQSQTCLCQIDARSNVDLTVIKPFDASSCVDFAKLFMYGLAKLLSLKGKLWIVALLLGALQLYRCSQNIAWRTPSNSFNISNVVLRSPMWFCENYIKTSVDGLVPSKSKLHFRCFSMPLYCANLLRWQTINVDCASIA